MIFRLVYRIISPFDTLLLQYMHYIEYISKGLDALKDKIKNHIIFIYIYK